MEVFLTILIVLVTLVAGRPTSAPQQTSSQETLHGQRKHYQSLRDAVHATADLLHHSKHAFHELCKDKPEYLPTFDEELATCQGFAQFLGTYHRERLNLPQIDDIKLLTTRSFSHQLKHVLTQSVHIMTSFQFVITNVTTLESRRICQHMRGHDVCELSCQKDVPNDVAQNTKFWCKCDKVAKRVKSAQETYIHALRALRMPIPEPRPAPDVSILPPSRDAHVISYHFAALHSLNTQTDHIENALSFVSNLARHEVL